MGTFVVDPRGDVGHVLLYASPASSVGLSPMMAAPVCLTSVDGRGLAQREPVSPRRVMSLRRFCGLGRLVLDQCAELAQQTRQFARDLHLGDADPLRDAFLGQVVVEAKGEKLTVGLG